MTTTTTNIVIAPATAKKAEKHGVKLTTQTIEATEVLVATVGTKKEQRTFTQGDTTAPNFLTAVLASLAYEAEAFDGIEADEAVVIEQLAPGKGDLTGEFVARLMKNGKPIGELARDPDLTDLLATLNDDEDPVADYAAGLREDAEGDEDEERSGSVVPDRFKKRYAEQGHAGHCGDWLAVTLNGLVQVLDGKKTVTDLDRLEAIATANAVDAARVDKLGTATPGWQGRYRMTVRNMLTKKVADKGFLFVPDGCGVKGDQELTAPKEWCVANATKTKPKKVVAKDEGAGKPSTKTVALAAPKADKPKQSQAEKLAAAKAKHAPLKANVARGSTK